MIGLHVENLYLKSFSSRARRLWESGAGNIFCHQDHRRSTARIPGQSNWERGCTVVILAAISVFGTSFPGILIGFWGSKGQKWCPLLRCGCLPRINPALESLCRRCHHGKICHRDGQIYIIYTCGRLYHRRNDGSSEVCSEVVNNAISPCMPVSAVV